jgi:hypothetical protein
MCYLFASILSHSNTCTYHLHVWLIDYLSFTSHSRIFHLYGDVTITGEGLHHKGLCSALRVFKRGDIFIVPHLLWHGTSVFLVSSEGPPYSVASYDTQGDVENLFEPASLRVKRPVIEQWVVKEGHCAVIQILLKKNGALIIYKWCKGWVFNSAGIYFRLIENRIGC